MLEIGDYARHQVTGLIGQVVGYGHEVVQGVYVTTLKVREIANESPDRSRFLEDVYSEWVRVEIEAVPTRISSESVESEVALQA
ncbi:hypothetical protein DA73_0400037980 [Tolypothrix bouteillei VB521301]|uniref:Uncharacterized protein n=3 Tax=Nostocales TaxID=1161 RepID=A0A8S9TH62_9CYAN|nr:hypothetical protein DA73_0400037980 [Tolypothrix bouteillei VB521301]